jgi:hypothetical protein
MQLCLPYFLARIDDLFVAYKSLGPELFNSSVCQPLDLDESSLLILYVNSHSSIFIQHAELYDISCR